MRMHKKGNEVVFWIGEEAYHGINRRSYVYFPPIHTHTETSCLILAELSKLYHIDIRKHELFCGFGSWPFGSALDQLAFIEELLGQLSCDVLTKEELERINKLNHV